MKLKITFVTDYVCPYCIVGKAALKAAIKEMGIDVQIETRPMELTVYPKEKVDTWNDAKRRERFKVLEQPAKELGLHAKFPPHVVPRPYTSLAFQGHYYALDKGLDDAYDDAVYRAYFEDELDIGEVEILADIADKVGLDREEFVKVLQNGNYEVQEKVADTYTKEALDVHSVPTMIIQDEKIQFTDYTKEDAIQILKRFI